MAINRSKWNGKAYSKAWFKKFENSPKERDILKQLFQLFQSFKAISSHLEAEL